MSELHAELHEANEIVRQAGALASSYSCQDQPNRVVGHGVMVAIRPAAHAHLMRSARQLGL